MAIREQNIGLVSDWNHTRSSNAQVLTTITSHAIASRLKIRPRLVSCTFYIIPILRILIWRIFMPSPSKTTVFGCVRLCVSLWVCASCKLYEHHISNQSREFRPVLVTYIFGFIDVLIGSKGQRSRLQQAEAVDGWVPCSYLLVIIQMSDDMVFVCVYTARWHWWSDRTVVLPRSFCRQRRRWHWWQQ